MSVTPVARTIDRAPRLVWTLSGTALAGLALSVTGLQIGTTADEAYRVATTVFWNRYLGGNADEPYPDSIVIDGIMYLPVGNAVIALEAHTGRALV